MTGGRARARLVELGFAQTPVSGLEPGDEIAWWVTEPFMGDSIGQPQIGTVTHVERVDPVTIRITHSGGTVTDADDGDRVWRRRT